MSFSASAQSSQDSWPYLFSVDLFCQFQAALSLTLKHVDQRAEYVSERSLILRDTCSFKKIPCGDDIHLF